jgi:hypothetical protein
MSYKPFNETPTPSIRNTSTANGIDVRQVVPFLQGVEIRDPLKFRRGNIPFMGARTPIIQSDGTLDLTIGYSDLGQDIKISTTPFTDTTEKFTPPEIIINRLAEGFLSELVDQQRIDEKQDSTIDVFSPYGLEVPFSARGTKASLWGDDPWIGTQIMSPSYRSTYNSNEFLDGQDVILGVSVPDVQTQSDVEILPFNDGIVDQTDRFGLNILNSDVELYDSFAAAGFVYSNNQRDSIAFGGLKD